MIAELRRKKLKLKDGFEFKSSQTPDRYQKAFVEAVAGLPFRFVVCTVNKSLPGTPETRRDIYKSAVEAVADALHEVYRIAEACKGSPLSERVVADRSDDEVYFRQLRAGFRRLKSDTRPGASLVKSVKLGHSHSDDLIQLADMVCGAVGRHLAGDDEFFNLLAGNRLDLITLSENDGRGRPEPPAS